MSSNLKNCLGRERYSPRHEVESRSWSTNYVKGVDLGCHRDYGIERVDICMEVGTTIVSLLRRAATSLTCWRVKVRMIIMIASHGEDHVNTENTSAICKLHR